MRPWTMRTLRAAVVAAGFAAIGTGTASATEASEPPMPDLTKVPDDIGFTAPLDACRIQEGPAYGSAKAPCADAKLTVKSPNLLKQAGVDIIRTSHGVAGEFQDGRPPLAPGKTTRVLGHVGAEANRAGGMTKTRPTLDADVRPGHTGVLNERTPDARLLDTELGPRQPDHQGVSTADTAVALDAARGYEVGPLAAPVGMVEPVLKNNPAQKPGNPVTLPRVSQAVPAAKQLPALAQLDSAVPGAVEQSANELAGGIRRLPG